MQHELKVSTYVEDSCLAMPVQGPEMTVLASIKGSEVVIEFHLPHGHVRFDPAVNTVTVALGQRPSLAEINRQVHHSVTPEDLDNLLREVALQLGLRESWAPRHLFRKERESSAPPPSN